MNKASALPTPQSAALKALDQTLSRVRPYMIIAPPRSASTALARCLLNHSRIGNYIHEPCDLYGHGRASIESITERLASEPVRSNSLIKEMTFQLKTLEVARCFLNNAKPPLVFLIRSPLLTVESRVRMVLQDFAKQDATSSQRARIKEAVESKDYRDMDDLLKSPVFPLAHTGWTALSDQVRHCRQSGIDYRVVNAADFRAEPERCLRLLSAAWKLRYESPMVEWTAKKDLPLGALADQSAWYSKVAASTGVLPETADRLPIRLPARFDEHLAEADQIYRQLLNDANVLIPKNS